MVGGDLIVMVMMMMMMMMIRGLVVKERGGEEELGVMWIFGIEVEVEVQGIGVGWGSRTFICAAGWGMRMKEYIGGSIFEVARSDVRARAVWPRHV